MIAISKALNVSNSRHISALRLVGTKLSNAKVQELALLRRGLSSGSNKGLLGLPAFKSAADFPLLAAEVAKKCEQLRLEIFAETDPLRTLLLLDQISNEVCSVIDVSEFCRVAHDDPEYRDQAEQAFSTLSIFIHSLNTDETLYTKLQNIVDNTEIFSNLPCEHQLFAKDLKSEFESGGIHLRGDLRDAAMALQGDAVASETKFLQDTSREGGSADFLVGPFMSELDYKRFSSWLGQYTEQSLDLPKNHVLCSANRRVISTVLKSLDEEPLRKLVWMNMVTQPVNNIDNLGNMIKNRQSLAIALGYKSFSHKYLANKVMKTPDEVQEFLSKIAKKVQPKAQKQLEDLKYLKYKLLGGKNSGVSINDTFVHPWDMGYLQGAAESELSSNNSSGNNQSAVSAVSEYFPLDCCVEGLIQITESLFGIKVIISDLSLSETWLNDKTMSLSDDTVPSSSSSFSPFSSFSSSKKTVSDLKYGYKTGAIKCVFYDKNDNCLGTVFLDLFNRPVKFPGAAHFTLRCGCSNNAVNMNHRNTNYTNNENRKIENIDPNRDENKNLNVDKIIHHDKYQLPVVALSFNFIQPSNTGLLYNKISNLSLSDIETLHHEWGHALHSLLSRTTFQHLSGTRGATDFVEVPSHLFEYFARTPSVVSTWARHQTTGKSLPPGLLEEALSVKKHFFAVDLQTQILYSAADQYVFGTEIGDVSKLTPKETYHHAITGIVDLQSRLTDLPIGSVKLKNYNEKNGEFVSTYHPSMSVLSHSHFVNYGGGYYSYIFARMYAAQIWENVFAKNPLSRKGGLILWDRMLRFGAATDSKKVLLELSGGEFKPDHYMKDL